MRYDVFSFIHIFISEKLLLFSSIGNLYSFPLVSAMDILIINGLEMILKIICQCDVNHIMTLSINIQCTYIVGKYIIYLYEL